MYALTPSGHTTRESDYVGLRQFRATPVSSLQPMLSLSSFAVGWLAFTPNLDPEPPQV